MTASAAKLGQLHRCENRRAAQSVDIALVELLVVMGADIEHLNVSSAAISLVFLLQHSTLGANPIRL